MLVDRGHDLVHSLAADRHRPHHAGAPVPWTPVRQRDHPLQIVVGGGGAVPVRLVHHEHIGDLEDARLHRLDRVAHAGREQYQGGVGEVHDVYFALAHTDRLDQDHVTAGAVEYA